MGKLLTALICISIFMPTPEAHALFGRRGPIARLLFGPGPQIIGGGRLLGRMRGCRNCRPRNSCNNNNNNVNDQFNNGLFNVNADGSVTDALGNQIQFDEFGRAFDIFGNRVDQFLGNQFGNQLGQFGNQFGSQFGNVGNFSGGCGSGGCRSQSRFGCNNDFSQFGRGVGDVFGQFDNNGIFNPSGSFGNTGSFNGNQFQGSQGSINPGQFGVSTGAASGGIIDPTGSGGAVTQGPSVGRTPASFNFGTVRDVSGREVDPFQNLGPTPTLNRTANGFFENGSQILVGQSPQCRLFKRDQFGNSVLLDPRNEIKAFNFYQQREAQGNTSPTIRCILNFYRQNFGNTPFFKPLSAQDNRTAETGSQPGGAHGGTTTPVGQRPVAGETQTVFSKWKGDFTADNAVKATDAQVAALTDKDAEDKKYKYTIIEQDCVSKSNQDVKIPMNMILFSSKDSDGKDQSHVALISGGLKEEDREKEVTAAWKRVTAEPNEDGGGKLRNVDGDPTAYYTTFATRGAIGFPETQIQMKKIVKNGQEQMMLRYVHKHGTSLPDNRWKIMDADQPYYCESHNQPKAQEVKVETKKAEETAPASDDSVKQPETKASSTDNLKSVQAVFASKCLRCHSSESKHATKFNKDGSLISGNPTLISKRVADGSMPEDGPELSSTEIAAIQQWALAKH